MIKNLVLGSEGFVGRSFCSYLRGLGEDVIPFDIKLSPDEDARHAILDLRNIDRVYFLAWDVGGAKYLYKQDTQLRQLDWNLKLMLNIMPQLGVNNIPFLFASSQLAEEYDTVYGVTKRLSEVWTHLLNGVRVRLWNVYGQPELPSERSHVVADFVYQAITTGEIRMLTTGTEQRQFIHIDDVSEAFHSALERRLMGLYDILTFEWVRVLDVANIIAGYTGAKVIPGERVGYTPLTPMKGKIPDWYPRVTLSNGLRRLVTICESKFLHPQRSVYP